MYHNFFTMYCIYYYKKQITSQNKTQFAKCKNHHNKLSKLSICEEENMTETISVKYRAKVNAQCINKISNLS